MINSQDHPFERYKTNWNRRRQVADVSLKSWPSTATSSPPQVCKLCDNVAFHCRKDWEDHVNDVHGGIQRYRNAFLCLQSLAPYEVQGSEWRATVSNFSEFYARSSVAWDNFSTSMVAAMSSPDGLPPELRWEPRSRAPCVFCARLHWKEDLVQVFLAGEQCFMARPEAVADLLDWRTYGERWPDIPEEELRCSAVSLRIGTGSKTREVLLHRRRVDHRQALGADPVLVCADCHAAFSPWKPTLCKYALANDLWLGRWHPVLRRANENLSHQMLLALARIVTTKVPLRPEASTRLQKSEPAPWDFLFNQMGMIGSAILFCNGRCDDALPLDPPKEGESKPASYPPASLEKAIAVTFTGPVPAEFYQHDEGPAMPTHPSDGLTKEEASAQSAVKRAVSRIAKLKVTVEDFLEESRFLQAHNYVYKTWARCDDTLLAKWDLRPGKPPRVPEVVLDTVVAVPTEKGDAAPRAEGPSDATASGAAEAEDAEFDAARQQQYISAFCPEDIPLDTEAAAVMEVAALERQLEDLDHAAQRSVAAEVESAIEGGGCLLDEAGRDRVLALCSKVRQTAVRLDRPEHLTRLQQSFQRLCGVHVAETELSKGCPEKSVEHPGGGGAGRIPSLNVPRGKKPLSLFDWRIWTQARPTLWCYGDASNLYPERRVPMLTDEWISCLLCREEMEYDVYDGEDYHVRESPGSWEINRFAADWHARHLFMTVNYLWERHSSAFAFLRQGGMKFAAQVRALTPEMLAAASRLEHSAGSIKGICANRAVPVTVKQALNAMQMAFADVVGTDGHRTLCRHEGNAYMALFGPPLIFCTPNLADTKQKLLMVVQGQEVRLDEDDVASEVLPTYREMMQRLARDPYGQTVVFELMMRLFFLHVLGVRPDCLKNRRRASITTRQEWCTDGTAVSSTQPGIFGPVLAFRGEIEAQGRGSLHPHILVWLLGMSTSRVVQILLQRPERFRRRFGAFMEALVVSVQSMCQSSIQALPRQFRDTETRLPPLGMSKAEQKMCKFDGGSEIETIQDEISNGLEVSAELLEELKAAEKTPESWRRPNFMLRNPQGMLLDPDAPVPARESVYRRPLSSFAVARTPGYRRLPALHQIAEEGRRAVQLVSDEDAALWQKAFSEDARGLGSEVLVHICGESCFKYSGNRVQQICRHGFYYVTEIGEWRRRRRGKALRNTLVVVDQTKYGMQGRIQLFQEHPFECQSNYAGLVALRCNLDVQDLRRVSAKRLPEKEMSPGVFYWMTQRPLLPHVGNRPEWGFMNTYDWDGAGFQQRAPRPCDTDPPLQWESGWSAKRWRDVFLVCLRHGVRKSCSDGAQSSRPEDPANPHGQAADSCESSSPRSGGGFDEAIFDEKSFEEEARAAFSDGVNTGFYINTYTTKQCPTMEGVLEEMRKGLERMRDNRDERLKDLKEKQERYGDEHLTAEERRALKGKTRFGETLDILKRLDASYKRCYWKSGAEMLFPILYGHMTFASHRCWTIFIKKAVFLAAEAWRRRYGKSARHRNKEDTGSEVLRFRRAGMDDYIMHGWKKRTLSDGAQVVFEAPDGSTHGDWQQAYDYEMAQKGIVSGHESHKEAVSFLQGFLDSVGTESSEREASSDRVTVTTSTLEDYLYRGSHPILAPMSFQVYAMWVYRIERPPRTGTRQTAPRFIDLDFDASYGLCGSHLQRIATELRVPMFQGFTMPPTRDDPETACLYKQLVVRPLRVSCDEGQDTGDAINRAFDPLSSPDTRGEDPAGDVAFSRNWSAYKKVQAHLALKGREAFLRRYEYPSIWETAEVQAHLEHLWRSSNDALDVVDEGSSGDHALHTSYDGPHALVSDPLHDHDRDLRRAGMHEYVAIIGEDVADNLEGLALARTDKKQRQYRDDAVILQSFIATVSGGGAADEDGADFEIADAGPQISSRHFEALPYAIDSSEEMQKILDYGFRVKLSPFVKELIALPCMQSVATGEQRSDEEMRRSLHEGSAWRANYVELHRADVADQLAFLELQNSRLQRSLDEAEPDDTPAERTSGEVEAAAPIASFANQTVFTTPGAFIADLVQKLPEKERLTRDQMLFVARFASACDEAWKDETTKKPPCERKVHHILLLGQGGSGKTHVVQNIVFKAVQYIWPSESKSEPTMMVCAASNAQAKNISTVEVKARTFHAACAMRVQKYENALMKAGPKKGYLQRLWRSVRVLIIEEVSMVSASLYNMLDYRSMCGRDIDFDVSGENYRLPDHHFGRVPIVIHLGDFLQLSPTASLSLIQDPNEKKPDGSYKLEKPPSVEAQHAMRVFKAIPHVFELRGTKRFKPGDPLIDFLACMRAGRRFPKKIWDAFAKTFATDGDGVRDPRHDLPKFRDGYGMALYWDTLARWTPPRAQRDAKALGVPLVFLQAVDHCSTFSGDLARRLLNVPNLHNTGQIPGVLPAHVGMEVRLTQKWNGTFGLVQEQKATIVDFLFKEEDRIRYNAAAPGELFRPTYLPAAIWLQVHDFIDSPVHADALPFVSSAEDLALFHQCEDDHAPDESLAQAMAAKKQPCELRAKGLLCYEATEVDFKWRSSEIHAVKRVGFCLRHANFFTSTASQGQTLRKGVTIDCARLEPQGYTGLSDADWWLHLYVMFSRATCMEDMLLLRPPPRKVLEGGPPGSVREALVTFAGKTAESNAAAESLAKDLGLVLPA